MRVRSFYDNAQESNSMIEVSNCEEKGQDTNKHQPQNKAEARLLPLSQGPRPAPLQFIAVGHGGKVSNLRKVRSHVSKEYHLQRKAKKKQNQDRLVVQRRLELRPNSKDLEVRPATANSDETEEVKDGNLAASQYSKENSPEVLKVLTTYAHQPSNFVQHGSNRMYSTFFMLSAPYCSTI